MNREIKFRAWDSFNATMIVCESEKWKDYLSKFFIEHDNLLQHENTPVLMQFTGVHDKNRKEIYEDDILKWDSDDNDSPPEISVVVWSMAQWCRKVIDGDGEILIEPMIIDDSEFESMPSSEVIGNIHQNPELLQTISN